MMVFEQLDLIGTFLGILLGVAAVSSQSLGLLVFVVDKPKTNRCVLQGVQGGKNTLKQTNIQFYIIFSEILDI